MATIDSSIYGAESSRWVNKALGPYSRCLEFPLLTKSPPLPCPLRPVHTPVS